MKQKIHQTLKDLHDRCVYNYEVNTEEGWRLSR
jgi:hypothetical protein